jgi:organic hydroperoxide reductase OsmC/OhrA
MVEVEGEMKRVGVGQRLIEAAERLCPYSRATHANISVAIKLICGR